MAILRPKIELLTDEYIGSVLSEAKSILENVGVLIENKEAKQLLNEEGVEHEQARYYIPEDLIDRCVNYAPDSIRLFDREGEEVIELSRDNIHFDPGSAAIFVQDLDSGEIREALSQDFITFSKIVEQLDNFDAQSTAIVYSDVPKEAQDWHRLYLALQYCSKPIVTGTFRTESFGIMRELLETTRTSAKKLSEKPLAIFDACPS
ncbi:MAG: trimethylamine methyltransferase family protein, partial [Candidatus Hodarchaeales archaeon]